MNLIRMIRDNWGGILLYSFVFASTWRLHEYGHLLIANLIGSKIVMNINRWFTGRINMYVSMAGPITTLLIAAIGTYLAFKYEGLKKVIGFYMTFSAFLLTFGSVLTGFNANMPLNIYNEYLWKATVFIPIMILLVIQVKYAELNLKPSCVFWLTIISIVIGGIIVYTDEMIWILNQQGNPITSTLFGQIGIVYLVDIFLVILGIYLRKNIGKPRVN